MKKTWDDITIEMWQELNSIQTDSEVTKRIEQISIITDTDSDEIRKMPMSEFNKWQEDLLFLSQDPKADVNVRLEIGTKVYGIIPQLNFVTAGEWIDAENWKTDPIGNMHLYAAMIYRPIVKDDGEVYEIEPHKSSGFLERAELFKKELSITKVHGAVLFFLSSVMKSMQIIEEYLAKNQI